MGHDGVLPINLPRRTISYCSSVKFSDYIAN